MQAGPQSVIIVEPGVIPEDFRRSLKSMIGPDRNVANVATRFGAFKSADEAHSTAAPVRGEDWSH